MQKQGATKIMSDLDSALWKRITQIVQKENRSFSYLDFVPNFEVDGQSYSIAHGTFRNKISDMLKAGKIQVVCYSPQAFYTLKEQESTDPMTGYHTGILISLIFTDISQMTQSIGLFRTFPWRD
jgi:aryl-alcohol dehydrogenase-like predicted oxidoreductase